MNKIKTFTSIFYIFIIHISITTLYSQDYTQKYNSIFDRYELFDSNGKLIGYKKYNSIFNRWEYFEEKKDNASYNNSINRRYQYPNHIETYDTNLMLKVLEIKQRQYDLMIKAKKIKERQKLANKIKQENYDNSKLLDSVNYKISIGIKLYQLLDNKLSTLGNRFNKFLILKKEMEKYNPKKLIENKTKKISLSELKKINTKIDEDINKTLDGLKLVNTVINIFKNNPNTVVIDTFPAIKRIDYQWDEITEKYEKYNESSFFGLIIFDKNTIEFIMPNNVNEKKYIYYDGFEKDLYLFYDSDENLITINKNKFFLEKYYNRSNDEKRYLKISRYWILNKEMRNEIKKEKKNKK